MKGEDKDMGKVAIYPGSFDPITYGHIDIIERGLEIFDKVIVAIAENEEKRSLFSVEERLRMVKSCFKDTPNVIVDSFKGLLVNYVGKTNAKVILRGLRATSDFEYEFRIPSSNQSSQPIFLFFGTGNLNFSFNRLTTRSGTNPSTAPPNLATSLMVLEETKK